ncbi:MAG: hypothetical protein RI922_1317 [Bacteroidota bacterium]|jgi:hypothetical protein
MKKVLILAYDFPPYVSVGGLRPYNWYLYFKEYQLEPIIITRQFGNQTGDISSYIDSGISDKIICEDSQHGTIIRTPYKPNLSNRLLLKHGKSRYILIRKVLTAYFEFAQYIFKTGPKKELFHAADDYLKKNKVDFIIATGEPFILLKYASELSKKHSIPWAADYRDPWSMDITITKFPLLKRWYRFYEKKVLKNASFTTVVAPFIAKQLEIFSKNPRAYTIPNGFNPSSVNSAKKIDQKKNALSLALAGTINDWHPIESLIDSIFEFSKIYPDKKIELNLFGIDQIDRVKVYIDKFNEQNIELIKFHPKLDNQLLLSKLAESHLMILFNNYSIIGTKIYDYLGIQRKILLCFKEDDLGLSLKEQHYNLELNGKLEEQEQYNIIKTHNAGIFVKNKSHLLDILITSHDELLQKGQIECDSSNIEKFSRKIQVEELSKLINNQLNQSNKKVLILAYDFPPYVSVGGLRPYNWYKNFKEFGVEPIVITRQWGNLYGNSLDYIAEGNSKETTAETGELGIILRTPYRPNLSNRLLLKYGENRFKILRKVITGFYEFSQFFIPIGPKAELYKAAKAYLKTNKVDVIIATGDPFVLFSYASKLGKKNNIPWIADYRDPWSQSFSAKKGFLQRKFDLFFEKRIVKTALEISTVDELFRLKLIQLFPSKSISIIPNGFDSDEMERVKNIKQEQSQLTFSFIGTMYKWHPISALLSDFSYFVNQHPTKQFQLKFYGINNDSEIKELIQLNFQNLKDKIQLIPKLPNGELLESLAKDNVLLLFNYYQFTGTKIYDYLGLQRKIVLCYENSQEANNLKTQFYFHTVETDITPQIDLINQTNSGIIVRDSEHLIEVMEELYAEFQEKGQIACNSIGVENYSRKIQVEKLAKLIKNLCYGK